MMEQTYYSEILNQYLIDIDFYNDKKKCLEYSDGSFYSSMGDLYQSNITLLKWEDIPSKEMFDTVKLLNIEAPNEYLFPKDRPLFINKFKKLKVISMPLVYALSIDNNSLPKSVEYLTLVNGFDQTDNLGNNKRERINNLLFPDSVCLSIKSLNLVTLSSASLFADGYLNVGDSNFPNLEFLRCIVSHKDKYSLLTNFTKLKHLWITINKNINLFEQIKSPIVSLNIDGAGTDLNISDLAKITSLEVIRINSSYNIIDCQHFLEMPNLKEIILLNSQSVKNIEALLNISSLKSLDIINCKGTFTTESKLLFKSNIDKFDRLSIDHSG